MLKQVGIRLEEELIWKVKQKAAENRISFQQAVSDALALYTNQQTPVDQTNQNQNQTQNQTPKTDNYYLLRKTHRKSKPITNNREIRFGDYTWLVLVESQLHYDKEDEIIPFRFTFDGVTYEPDEEEIKALEKYHGKPVKIEE